MIALVPSRSICQMLQIFLEMNSKELRLSSKTRKKVVFLTSRPPENVKLRRLWSCNYGQKMSKKSVLHVQSCWCPFSLPSPSSLVKFPSNTDQSQHRQQLDEPTSRQKVPSAGETHEWKLRLGLVPFWLAQKVARDLWANYKAWHRSISATIFVEILLSRN